ncbi:MAG TPA: PD-(D/E)XK nuclease family protein [Actinomycetes bacterium]|nr:PD-(D/E)XK nuclease family protein [Actinomycetes bacterium]
MVGVDQLGFEGMPRRLFAATPSRLNAWLDCPRRYRMTYVDRPQPRKGPPWAHNSLGASVHNALAGWWRLPVAKRTTDAAGRLLAAGWLSDGYRDEVQSKETRERASEWIVRYVDQLDPRDEPLGVERIVATRTETLAVSGRIDRLDGRGGELVVVDYKTGRHALSTDDARGSLALALYALAAERTLRRPCRRVELHHLPTGRVISWEHQPDTLQRHLSRAEEIAAECSAAEKALAEANRAPAGAADPVGPAVDPVAGSASDPGAVDALFPPLVGAQCGWCDFRAHCPEGSAGYPAREPWAGL